MKKKNKKLNEKMTEVINEDGTIKVKALEKLMPKEKPFPKQTVIMENGIITIRPPADASMPSKEPAKKVITTDLKKKENGFLIELGKDGKLSTSYLSAASPGAFKGYHLHKVREANYVCIRGKIKVIMYTPNGREEHILSADKPERLHIPTGIPTGLSNDWSEEAWIVNSPNPPFDPDLLGEQVDFTEEECELRLYLKK